MNRVPFQEYAKGHYGRKVAYTDVNEITEQNIVRVLGEGVSVFNYNKPLIKYLWDYKKGDQPVLYRQKIVRDDIVNNVVENHAWEIVRFKNGQTYGEPIQLVSLSKDEKVSEIVEKFNKLMKHSNKQVRDIDCGEWTSAVGTGYKGVQLCHGAEIPFRIIVPTPMNTFIIYSRNTNEPMMSVQELKDENGYRYFQCFTPTHEYQIKNSQLVPLTSDGTGNLFYSRLHTFGGIPIVEYPNNQDRISDIELVITMLDAINNMQSNRSDAIEQFVQSWIKFVNCDVDEDTFKKMKMMGALVVKSNNGSENKADVDIMTQELNQTESQVAKDDLWNNILTIEAIPNKQGNTGGDSQGAVELRNGWDFSKQASRLKDAYVEEAENRLTHILLNILRIEKGRNAFPISCEDFEINIVHSPTDNLYTKTQSLQLLLQMGIHPLVAIKTCGLWNDSEKTFLISKPYLDGIYKTAEQIIAENKELQAQELKAQEILNANKASNKDDNA